MGREVSERIAWFSSTQEAIIPGLTKLLVSREVLLF